MKIIAVYNSMPIYGTDDLLDRWQVILKLTTWAKDFVIDLDQYRESPEGYFTQILREHDIRLFTYHKNLNRYIRGVTSKSYK
jgi:hypothetical protein